MAEDPAPHPPKRPPRRIARRLGALLWPYRWQVAVALALTLTVAFLGPLRPRLVQVAVDEHITTGDLPGLLRIVGLIGLVLVGEGLAFFALGYLTQWVGQHALYDLRTRVFRFVERQRLAFFDRTPIGTLITRATSDIEALADLLSAGAVTMIGDLGRLLFIGYFMLSLDLELGLVALLALPPMVIATEVFRRKMRRAYRETRKQVGRLNAFLQEHVSGMSVVQIFGREGEEQRRFEAVNADHRDAHIQTVYYYALFYPVVDIIASAALGLVIWFGGTEAMREAVTIGTLIAFVQYVRMFFEPVRNLSRPAQLDPGRLRRVGARVRPPRRRPIAGRPAPPRPPGRRPRPRPDRLRGRVVRLRAASYRRGTGDYGDRGTGRRGDHPAPVPRP